MKKIFSIISFWIVAISCSAQQGSLFVIKDSTVAKDFKQVHESYLATKNAFLFEDDNYAVRKTCSGEWGGSIWFKNKKTGIEYASEATCPVVVNKLDGKYIVTNTLAHLSGFTQVLEISNPDSLEIFELPKPRQKKGKTIVRYVGDNQSKSKKGTIQLIDSVGVLTLASFPYQGDLFHIITDFKRTFVSKIENKRFVTIDTVSNEGIWTYNPEVIKTKNDQYIVFFNNKEVKGYLEIDDNLITLYRFKE
ncbi:hypothetical protein [Pontibacter chinhatensis]|uniref:WG containing repeat-containing protein n=1 Tax=Pontibacter chinhatensis TaxID=1436961 RepID=A0A1I2VCC5_9BACT|nr:hypothetical protein [Pontibacter chinhatensis]SFG87014.1 hypothetical protein SAMN05421739_104136 [Pontibacter chinhatensis]